MIIKRFVALLVINAGLLVPMLFLLMHLRVPPMVLELEVAVFSMSALAYGFGFIPFSRLLRPLWSKPVSASIVIVLGLTALVVPPNFMVAAWLMGFGIRRLWMSACELAAHEEQRNPNRDLVIVSPRTDLVIDHPNGVNAW